MNTDKTVLQIAFNFYWHFLSEVGTSSDDGDDLEKISWLIELMARKKSALPYLRRINIVERNKQPKGFAYSKTRWNPPGQLQDQLETNGVEFDAWLRSPLRVREESV